MPQLDQASKASRPLVSIIITNYNYGRFVGQAIHSALSQTYDRVECVVVDDGSTDESRDVIAGYPTVVAIPKENGGQASAARAGLAASRGEILMFLDSDDFLHPEAAARVVDAWRPGTSAVFFALDVLRHGKMTGERLPNEPFLSSGHLAYAMRYGYLPCSPTSGNAFARHYVEVLFREALGMDGNCFDAYLLFSAPVAGQIVTLDECLGTYRIHETNISLVNSTSASRVAAHVYYQYWAQQTLERMLDVYNLRKRHRKLLRGPYHLRWHLMTRDVPVGRFALPSTSRVLATVAGLWESAVWPAMPLRARLRNMAVIGLFGLAPRPLRRRLRDRVST
jgi:glycosyltransferase involved in cell wall biosynthesis